MRSTDFHIAKLKPGEWKRRCSVLSDRITRERSLCLPWPERRKAVLELARMHRYPPEGLAGVPLDQEGALVAWWDASDDAALYVGWRTLADACAEQAEREEAGEIPGPNAEEPTT